MKGQLHLILYAPVLSSKPQNDHTHILLEAAVSTHLPDRGSAQPSLSQYWCSKRLNEGSHASWENTETSLECAYLMHEEKPVCLRRRNEIAGWLCKDRVRRKSCTQQRLILTDRYYLRDYCAEPTSNPEADQSHPRGNYIRMTVQPSQRTLPAPQQSIHPSWLPFLCE